MWSFEVFKHEDGGWRWRLVQRKVLIVAESSESYGRRSDAVRSAESARLAIGAAVIAVL